MPNNFRTFGTCLPRPPGIPVREIPGIYAYRIFNFFLLESWFMYVLLSNITQLLVTLYCCGISTTSFHQKTSYSIELVYRERLKCLNIFSLELRRLHTDLFWCYKIVFGLVYVNLDDLFVFSPCQLHSWT